MHAQNCPPPGRRRSRAVVLLPAFLLVGLLSACTTLDRDARLQLGRSTGADILAWYGPPSRIWPEADGGRSLQYASQPFGQHCQVLRLGPDDRLLSRIDALSAQARERVQPGMSPEQVSRLLCQERSRVVFAHSGEEVWDWTVDPELSHYGLRFNVHFKNGHVLRTSHSMVFDDELWMRR